MTADPRVQRPTTLAKTINQTLGELMTEDPRVLLLGQDIGDLGGVFRVTSGLLERFGRERVRDSIIAESAIVGEAIGMSIAGMLPICEIQFDGFTYPAVNQMVTQAPRIAQRWGGRADANIVVRIPSGGGTRAVEHHSESNESLFARAPGIRVGFPSSGEDYRQMLHYALGQGGPTVLYEPIRLYHRSRTEPREAVTDQAPHRARVLRTGTDVTVACHGAITQEVLKSAEELSDEINIEVIDLRWMAPLDVDTVLESVARTGRFLMVHEAPTTLGIGAELTALVAERGWDILAKPPKRLAPPSVHYPPADEADEYLLDQSKIITAVKEMVA